MRKPITAVTVLLALTTLCSCLQPMKRPVPNESAESSASVTSRARNGSSEPISTVKPDEVTYPAAQTDYDSSRPGSENTVLAESESYPDSFDWHMGREIGAIDFSPSCSSAD